MSPRTPNRESWRLRCRESSANRSKSKGSRNCKPKRPPANNDDDRIIESYFDSQQQTESTFLEKIRISNVLAFLTRAMLPSSELFVTGSTYTGLCGDQGDLDMCLSTSTPQNRPSSLEILEIIKRALRKIPEVRRPILISARVPIVRFKWRSSSGFELECDLNLGHDACVRNTHLLHAYISSDRRTSPLLFWAKHWASSNGVKEARLNTLSSYAVCLMVISFLQTQTRPPVLPVLQENHREMFSPTRKLSDLYAEHEQMGELIAEKGWASKNRASLSQLFHQFLDYYASFDFEQRIISVRTGQVYEIDEDHNEMFAYTSLNSSRDYLVNIEEPFEFYNVGRSVVKPCNLINIKNAFRQSLRIWNLTGNVEKTIECCQSKN